MASNYAINKKLGLEFLKFTNYILENMEELLIVK
jgi:hypothetical protein